MFNEVSAVFFVIYVETPGTLNGHSVEHDGSCFAIHREQHRPRAFAAPGGSSLKPNLHIVKFFGEFTLQKLDDRARVAFESQEPTTRVG